MKCPMNSDEPNDDNSFAGNHARNEVDFSEFVWMGEENLEEFDRKVELELWEEQFIESCFEEMWREEERDAVYFTVPQQMTHVGAQNAGGSTYNYPAYQQRQPNHLYQRQPLNGNGNGNGNIDVCDASQHVYYRHQDDQDGVQTGGTDLSAMMGDLSVQERNGINQVMSSKLNPNAAVFIPRSVANSPSSTSTTNVDR